MEGGGVSGRASVSLGPPPFPLTSTSKPQNCPGRGGGKWKESLGSRRSMNRGLKWQRDWNGRDRTGTVGRGDEQGASYLVISDCCAFDSIFHDTITALQDSFLGIFFLKERLGKRQEQERAWLYQES